METDKVPVLIACYLRPSNLQAILEIISESPRRVYIQIDYPPLQFMNLHLEILSTINSFTTKLEIVTKINPENLGVQFAVPFAIDWVLGIESSVLVLEDDCIPNQSALAFFDESISLISGKVVLISGRCPSVEVEKSELSLSNYALTNGWLVTKQSWDLIRPTFRIPNIREVITSTNTLFRYLPFSFFLAACISVNRGKSKAWDCFILLRMIVNNYYSISPDKSCITVLGVDEYASNTKPGLRNVNEIYSVASTKAPSSKVDVSKRYRKETNRTFIREVYNIRWFHIFSPIKALLK